MPKKKRIRVRLKTENLAFIQQLNLNAEKFEKGGIKSFKEGRANEMQYRFDMARCLRTAADFMDSDWLNRGET